MERIGDILKISSFDTPKRITFDLSEDGTFYNVKIYTNIIDKSKNEKYEGCIECKSGLHSVETYSLIFDNENKNPEIFTITIPEGYEDGLKNRNGFTEEDFSEDELRMLKLAFALVDCDTETRRESRYDNDEVNAVYSLKEKLKIDGIV